MRTLLLVSNEEEIFFIATMFGNFFEVAQVAPPLSEPWFSWFAWLTWWFINILLIL